MCGKKLRRGFLATLVLLVLVLSPLAAWPTWLTGAPKEPTVVEKIVEVEKLVEIPVEKIVEVKVPMDSQETLALIQSMKDSATQLETELNGLKAELTSSQKLIEALGKELKEQQKLSETSKASYDSLKKDYDKLLVAKKGPAFGGLVSGGVIWNPTAGTFGAEANMGISYRDWSFIVGLEYEPAVWAFALPSLTDISVKAGVQFAF